MRLFAKKTSFQDAVVNKKSTEFEVNKWIISEFVVQKLVPVVGSHPFPLDELMLMTSAVVRFKPQLILEWGTNIGKSARVFYEACEAFNVDAEVHSVDLPDNVFHKEHPKEHRGMHVKGIKKVVLHQGDGVSKSLELYRKLSPDRVLFFIDGDHNYEPVKHELGIVLKEIPNAAVLLHDTLYQSPDSGYCTGPFDAINDVLGDNVSEYTRISTLGGRPGMTLLFRKNVLPH